MYLFAFFFAPGALPMTMLAAGALTDPQLPATASHVCATDEWLGGVGRVAKFLFPTSSHAVIIQFGGLGLIVWLFC